MKGDRRMKDDKGHYGYGQLTPGHMRHRALSPRVTRLDAHGQVIIETEENLSDKEIYPPSHMTIPSIGKVAFFEIRVFSSLKLWINLFEITLYV